MKNPLRSSFCTEGRRMAGARALWHANGMKKEQFGKPIIAIVNSFTQFVPGHTHLHEVGQLVKAEIEKLGCYAAEFNTIAIDDGIAMGHDGMLYSLPSRDIIADSVEYMVNAHKADAMVCISNCDKITPGMLMAAMRLNIPAVFVSGGPMEAHKWRGQNADLITAMVKAADDTVSQEEIDEIEECACPGCGSCSGMFTANSMNCLTEAIGLSLPGNGTILATHANRIQLFKDAAALIVRNAYKYYEEGDERVLPRSIATRQAFLNAMTLDIAMGGSTNTVLHLLAVANEAGVDFKMADIDALSRKVPCLCKLAPNTQKFSIQECNRAGGILNILGELAKASLLDLSTPRVNGATLGEDIEKYSKGFDREKIRLALDSIVSQTGDGKKSFSYAQIEKGRSRARDYRPAVEWLRKAHLVYSSASLSSFDIPLSMYAKQNENRFYLYDIGLFFSLVSGDSALLRNTILSRNWKGAAKGRFYEALAADLLHKNNHELYYYDIPQKLEIDFVIETDKAVVPLEVKSGNNKATSLIKLLSSNDSIPRGIKFTESSCGEADRILTLPLFMAAFL